MTRLFDRVSEVTINNRTIQSLNGSALMGNIKLDIDITHTALLNAFPVATVVIWNPSEKTIGECQSTKDDNDEVVYPSINIKMGYVGGIEGIMNGAITAFKVDKSNGNKTLTITASEKDTFKPVIVHKSFVEKKASYLFEALAPGFTNKIDPGEDVLIPSLVVRDTMNAIRQVASLSKSAFFISNGKLNIIPATLTPNNSTIVDFNSGLLDRPEKIESADKKEKGYLVKTLPLVGVRAGSSLKAIWNSPLKGIVNVNGVVYDSKISLPSSGDAMAEYKVAA